ALRFGSCRSVSGIADDGSDALVVEPDWHSAGCDVHGHPIPRYEGAGMVHFDSTSSHHLHRKRMKRTALRQSIENLLKAISRHQSILPRQQHDSPAEVSTQIDARN